MHGKSSNPSLYVSSTVMPQLRNSACVGLRSPGSQTTSARRCSSVTTCARRLVPPKTRRRTADSEPKETTLTNTSLTPKGPEYYDSLIQESVNDSKTLWSSLKSMLHKKATTVTQSVITADGAETKEPLEVANAFNSFFTSVGATLQINSRMSTGQYQPEVRIGSNSSLSVQRQCASNSEA